MFSNISNVFVSKYLSLFTCDFALLLAPATLGQDSGGTKQDLGLLRGATTLSIMTFGIMTLSIMALIIRVSKARHSA